MIPQEKSAVVFRGLCEVFGAAAIEDIRRITRGLSSDLMIFGEMFSQTYWLRSNAADRDLYASTKMSRITPAPRPMS